MTKVFQVEEEEELEGLKKLRLDKLQEYFCNRCQSWGPICTCGTPELLPMQDCGVDVCAECFTTMNQG
eukprot:CAMPEP_0179052656 /NCGR_PEP_ID=MMETSP0796-20121207/21869_1 /TAXON_ID=73915 /ORGANISM="Pyrodinium bahamense, Strain pbaha01" /LENGTH=67 /DNA_ID=CAMNT_0020749227 /DNA_START=27 /DNA_END=226 /DNA_ORIENTATION=-